MAAFLAKQMVSIEVLFYLYFLQLYVFILGG